MIDDGGENSRMGPRPLGLHLGLASMTVGSAAAALPLAMSGTLPWLSELEEEGAALQQKLSVINPAELMLATGQQGQRRLQQMMSGIQKYQAHSYKRSVPKRQEIWGRNGAALFEMPVSGLSEDAPIMFMVPSLVNRSYILDLKSDRSFFEALHQNGIRPILLDWGEPKGPIADFTLDQYLLEILYPAFEYLIEKYPTAKIHILGYCMGGTISVPLVEAYQKRIASFVAVAAPWDFHADLGAVAKMFFSATGHWRNVCQTFGNLPVDMLQTLFTALDPNLCMRKFAMFDTLSEDSAAAEDFVALEDWLNDGVPLSTEVALQCLGEWYGLNAPMRGEWFVEGQKVCPQNITIPSMIAVPKSDKIVPPSSALALADVIPNAVVVTPPSGHVGMMAGARAPSGLWQEVINWVEKV